jgi:Fe-Mn family superoxide dismutase
MGALAIALAPCSVRAQPAGYTLPKLPYAYDALEPHIDAETMKIHYDRHHQAYVDNLNKALAGHPELLRKPIEELIANIEKLPKELQPPVTNNGGGHFNHSLFWTVMDGKGGGEPSGRLGKQIAADFESFAKFQTGMTQSALTRFGSGWAWLVVEKGKLAIRSTANQYCPVMDGITPILGLDVWEHAYYLKYQNRRGDYIKAWWNVVNWPAVAARYEKTVKG